MVVSCVRNGCHRMHGRTCADGAVGRPGGNSAKLNAQFRLTTTTADRSDIVTAGDVVVIHKPGLVMFSGTAVPSTNNYKGGVISQGFGTVLIMTNPNTVQRAFVPQEKCWVIGITVQKDGVVSAFSAIPITATAITGT